MDKKSTNVLARSMRKARDVVNRRLSAPEFMDEGVVPSSMRVCTNGDCKLCEDHDASASPFRLIYVCPGWDIPSGGQKVIYQHVQALADKGLSCFVFHPDKPGSSYTWMKHHVKSLKLSHFNPARDFLVFPEVWATLAAKFCIPAGIAYAIFVQNGYLVHFSGGFDPALLSEAYRHATLVLSISEDTSEMLPLVFPKLSREHIYRVVYSVPSIFAPTTKEPVITYMPRKLRTHAERMEKYLQNSLPADWRLKALDNISEREVAENMARSSIFLSFSDMEGYPIPPLEAALSGNLVVGYSGQGGREYFQRPIFREVPNGNFRLFISEIHAAIRDVENGATKSSAFATQVEQIKARHSVANEVAHLVSFADLAKNKVVAQTN